MTAVRLVGPARALVVLGALVAFPLLVHANWVINIAVFTLMYAGLATAWNLFAGYSGYISLGHVAFFGIGAYTLANLFSTSSPIHGGSGFSGACGVAFEPALRFAVPCAAYSGGPV